MLGGLMLYALFGIVLAGDDLAREFVTPPASAKPWCYWWWLNGAASREGITRDFEEMRKQGIGAALLFDAGEAGPEAPRGPKFMSAHWRELFKHAVREADRCGIVLTVNLSSGWNAGGPWVIPEHAGKLLVASQSVVSPWRAAPSTARSARNVRQPAGPPHCKPPACSARCNSCQQKANNPIRCES
jgi:hypothetical protein